MVCFSLVDSGDLTSLVFPHQLTELHKLIIRTIAERITRKDEVDPTRVDAFRMTQVATEEFNDIPL